jgi:hypothetical protein
MRLLLGMGEYDYWKGCLNLSTDRETDAAAHYLEQRGKRFLVDFGTENAWSIAWDLLETDEAQSCGFIT